MRPGVVVVAVGCAAVGVAISYFARARYYGEQAPTENPTPALRALGHGPLAGTGSGTFDGAGPERALRAGMGEGPPPAYSARDANEWQGMRIDMSNPQICRETRHCGLALACTAGACGPCRADAGCMAGEACVLEHCVRNENADCRRRADCEGDALCVLTGYSTGPRGNEDMRSMCLAPTGGVDEDEANRPPVDVVPSAPMPVPVPPQELLDSLTP